MIRVGYFLGTHEDWGGGSRALLNFVRAVDRDQVEPVVVLTKEGILSSALAAESIECHSLPKEEVSRNIFAATAGIVRAIRFLKQNAIDIVHLNYSTVGWKPAMVLAAKLLKVPVVYHYHGRVPSAGPFVKYSDIVIMVSDFIREQSDTSGVPARTIHNIVDLHRFGRGKDIRGALGISADKVIVSFVGQVKLIKGIKTFLNAIAEIPNQNVAFLIVGEFRETAGDFTKATFSHVVDEDLRIRYLGYRSDIQDLYATSDIIVMPSLYDEPCAMVLFESAAASKPIVASATGGTPEIIQDGQNGFLFPRDDSHQLAKAITRLIEDHQLRAEMGKRAYETAMTNFERRPVLRLQEAYAELLR